MQGSWGGGQVSLSADLLFEAPINFLCELCIHQTDWTTEIRDITLFQMSLFKPAQKSSDKIKKKVKQHGRNVWGKWLTEPIKLTVLEGTQKWNVTNSNSIPCGITLFVMWRLKQYFDHCVEAEYLLKFEAKSKRAKVKPQKSQFYCVILTSWSSG